MAEVECVHNETCNGVSICIKCDKFIALHDEAIKRVLPEQVAQLQAENERLVKEVSQLAIESVNRVRELAKLEAEVEYMKKYQNIALRK